MPMQFIDKPFTFTQPDKSQLKVLGTGNQFHATFRTLDGFTIVKDAVSGFYHYAQLSPVGDGLQSTGIRVGAADPKVLGLTAGIEVPGPVRRALALAAPGLPRTPSRWEVRRNERRLHLQSTGPTSAIAPAPPQRPTAGNFVGLCLLIQFPDIAAAVPRADVDDFCNKKGYSGFGNNGSVYDYFTDVSDGKLHYTNIVAPVYTTKHPRDWYTNPAIPFGQRAREMIKEALAFHLSTGFDFSRLTTDDKDYVYAVNVFYAGQAVNNWSEGLWPHSSNLITPFTLAPHKLCFDYQITDMDDQLSLGTFCHENGHMICDFPDLYDYGYESNGDGVYCLMCAGGVTSPKNPTQIGAYLKHSAGWSSSVIGVTPGTTTVLHAGRNEFGMHRKNNGEYFIMENRNQTGRDASLTDSGLTVWHVDELGSNNNESMTPASHYECALVQADGRNDLEHGTNNGDRTDLFKAGQNDRLSDTTNPNSKWWDGSASGMELKNIGVAGSAITFDFGP